eukprot:3172199-Prymnesium_polylepis.1
MPATDCHRKRHDQRAFFAGLRSMSSILFSKNCREDLLDPIIPSCRHFLSAQDVARKHSVAPKEV